MRWLALAVFVSSGSIVVMTHGISLGGSVATGVILSLTTTALLAAGDWRRTHFKVCDIYFIGFVGCASISTLLNPLPAYKELVLLGATLLCYPAGRLFSVASIDSVFSKVVLTIATVGALIVLLPIIDGRINSLGRPNVFGDLSAAPAQFMLPVVLAVGALLSRDKIIVPWIALGLIMGITAVFAAAMVRFTFIAAFAALIVLGAVSSARTRRWLLTAAALLVAAVTIGQASRFSTALKYEQFALQSLGFSHHGTFETQGSECPTIDENNSIEIRRSLYRDWARLIVDSQSYGIGLDGFMKRSCHPSEEVHNDLLQVALEFGWLSAGLLAILMVEGILRAMKARHDEQGRFALFALSFLILMSMAHGRVSREFPLFFFIGYAVSLTRLSRPSTNIQTAQATSPPA